MSDASTRPRPRPKPRPKAVQKTPSDSAAATGGASTSSVPTAKPQDEDDDAMFIRQPRNNESAFEFVSKINRDLDKPKTVETSDSDEDVGTPRRRQVKKRKGNVNGWQNSRNLERFMSQEASDTGSDLELLEDTPKGAQRKRKRDDEKKQGSRSRSRSKSITPPPELTQDDIRKYRIHVRQTVAGSDGNARANSPTRYEVEDDSADLTLDPDLQRIIQNAKARQQTKSQTRLSSPPPTAGEGPKVTLTVKWQPHPLNEHAVEKVWAYLVNRNSSFRDVFEEVAEEGQVLSENLVLSYRGHRFFPSVSPSTLHIYDQAEIVACDKRTWDFIRASRNNVIPERTSPPPPTSAPSSKPPSKTTSTVTPVSLPEHDVIEFNSSGDEIEIVPTQHEEDEDASDDDNDNKVAEPEPERGSAVPEDAFSLNVRSGLNSKAITLVVRPTATCGAIVKGYLKKAGLADQYAAFMNGETAAPAAVKNTKRRGAAAPAPPKIPALSIDGDRVGNDEEIGNHDLEDGDMVEVVGL
ncbi:hypothetical protein V5O48_005038 [Marasmius crinis-equi]|uniref:Rad60/SUMO-like domain-containing protein n=1 Tax=Marasmius crinis-equi TaxID=585013 RepID=A0ABR3FP40_9AGAR